ncbi:helix-turn-helix domain-containing protein [Acidiphilium sp.]|uniref:helix-turn-helix domain-containing protein n=1 Tax=Acidiphilium sp. TaxID=527 RepID=UPI00258F19FD|nr:helix-turn-helix domain-containing protein [Acidiphilium sp.]
MSSIAILPSPVRHRREKVFGPATGVPLDREAKVRIMTRARALLRATEAGKHYGLLTAKTLAVLEALLWGFHNSKSGQCMPSYDTIAERAGCARSTVALALKALEAVGLLIWVNRLTRVIEPGRDLVGRLVRRWRTIRTSNAYAFRDPKTPPPYPKSSKSEFQGGTPNQESLLSLAAASAPPLDPKSDLAKALKRLGNAIRAAEAATR